MNNPILILPIIAGFFITLFLIPFWMKKAKQIGLLWIDMNKSSGEKVAGSGGVIAVGGFIIGVFIYIGCVVFYLKSNDLRLIEIFSLLNVVLLLAGIGFVDDLLGWQRGGLSKRTRLILAFISAMPLVAINAGKSNVSLLFIGSIDLGLLYPLIAIPIGVIGASTTFNMLAGYNGLEAGQGVIILAAMAIVSFFTGNTWLALIALCMMASLFGFLFYNFYPARVFPGDSLTYAVGGLIAGIAILGNFEKIAIFFFIPYIIEVFLKMRGNLMKQSFGKAMTDGSLEPRYNKIYGLEHFAIFAMKKAGIKPTEKRVVYFIWGFQIIIILLGILIFREGIFK